jgi:glutathione S-transferase
MSLVFYYAPWSSASTCRWAIEELGIPCERVKVDLAAKGTRTPEYLALNPNGKVPLLVHDGVPIFESIAILAHLGETFGVDKGLFPAPGLLRAQAFQWLAWMNVTLGATVWRFVQHTSDRVPEDLRNPKLGDIARAEVRDLLGILDRHLEGKSWMVGGAFSLVDVHLAGGVSWVARQGFETAATPALADWFERCKARPAFAIAAGP